MRLVARHAFLLVAAARADVFLATNLVTDDPSANPAMLTDPNLKNAWGISATATSPFWVSDNGTGVATLYQVDAITNVPTKVNLEVTIPGDGSVTGQINNPIGAGGYNGDAFLFVSEDGTISGWRGALGTNAEVLQSFDASNVYKGTTAASVGGHGYLYSTNFHTGAIDILKGDAGAPDLTGNFTDPNLPSGYAPFGIQKLGSTIYVTYALQDAAGRGDVAGAGHGFVNAFDFQGNFVGPGRVDGYSELAVGAGDRARLIWSVYRRPAGRQLRRRPDQRLRPYRPHLPRPVERRGRPANRDRWTLGPDGRQQRNRRFGRQQQQCLLHRRAG